MKGGAKAGVQADGRGCLDLTGCAGGEWRVGAGVVFEFKLKDET